MRYDKNKMILIVTAVVLSLILLVLLIIAIGGVVNRKPIPTAPYTTTINPDGENVIIETPYGNVEYPGTYAQYLKVERVEVPELKLEFIAELPSGKTQKLFSIRFGDPMEPAVGQLVSPQGVPVGVYVTTYGFVPDGSWAVRESTVVTEMLEAVNEVIARMELDPLGSPIPDVDGDELVIETPYCKLYYPAKWEKELRTVVNDSDGYEIVFRGVIFGHDPIDLFAVNFGGSEAAGQIVHTLIDENGETMHVRMRTFTLEIDGWIKLDQEAARSMLDDLNHTLSKLTE